MQGVMPKELPDEWVLNLRQEVKKQHGFGWNVRDLRGRVQLSRRLEDKSRSAVILPIAWNPKALVPVLKWLDEIVALMEDPDRQLSLKGAFDLAQLNIVGSDAAKPKQRQIAWSMVKAKFMDSIQSLRATSRAEWERRIDRTIAAIESKPKPRNGEEVLERYRQLFFLGPAGENDGPNVQVAPGGKGRTRNLADACRFLRFAVKECGVSTRYLPPEKQVIDRLIGDPPEGSDDGEATTALKPDEFAQLLDDLLEEGKRDLYVATALIGYLGLRPGELASLHFDGEGRARVGAIKRNIKTIKKPPKARLVLPVEVPGRDSEGARVLCGYRDGDPEYRLPLAIRNQIAWVKEKNSYRGVGECFRQLLERSKAWSKLVANNPDLVPYSLRHGFAYRATFGKERLTMRVAAALMGHDSRTHAKHYGRWTDDESLLIEVERINQAA